MATIPTPPTSTEPTTIASWRNVPGHYGRLARWLHWGTALLLLGSYASIYYREWFTQRASDANAAAMQLHFSIGITILVLMVLRLVWRVSQPQPVDVPAPRLQLLAAHAMHWALYAALILMPLTGYLTIRSTVHYFGLFDIPSLAQTPLGGSLGDLRDVAHDLHETAGAWVVWVLVVLHAAAGLYHHVMLGDRVLVRMLPPGWSSRR